MIRHNLDVMHVEKNVSKSIIGIRFCIKGKTKDTLQSQLNLVDLDVRHNLHPVEDGGKIYLPSSCFTLSKKEKRGNVGCVSFCQSTRWLLIKH